MINLDNYPKFKADISGNTTNIHPILIIKSDSDNTPDIYLSSINETMQGIKSETTGSAPFEQTTTWTETVKFYQVDLKMPSFRESIDLESKKLKTNSVNVTISNFLNFSDLFLHSNYYNRQVDIYWKSPSCSVLDDCLPVYKGIIKRFSHDNKVVNISIEDLTEGAIHTEVPISTISKTEAYNKNYVNKTIPMTYGIVDKAPAVLWKNAENDTDEIKYINVITDRYEFSSVGLDDNYSGHNANGAEHYLETTSPLSIYTSNYLWIPREYTHTNFVGDSYPSTNQWSIHDGKVRIIKKFKDESIENALAENVAQVVINRNATTATILEGYHSIGGVIYNYWGASDSITIDNLHNVVNVDGVKFHGNTEINNWNVFGTIPIQGDSSFSYVLDDYGWIQLQNFYDQNPTTSVENRFRRDSHVTAPSLGRFNASGNYSPQLEMDGYSFPLSKHVFKTNYSNLVGSMRKHLKEFDRSTVEIITLPDSKKIYDYFVLYITDNYPELLNQILPWESGEHQWTAHHEEGRIYHNMFKIEMERNATNPNGFAYVLFGENVFGETIFDGYHTTSGHCQYDRRTDVDDHTTAYRATQTHSDSAMQFYYDHPQAPNNGYYNVSKINNTGIYESIHVEFWDLINTYSGRQYGHPDNDIPRFHITGVKSQQTTQRTHRNEINGLLESAHYNYYRLYNYNASWNGVDENIWENTGESGGYNKYNDDNTETGNGYVGYYENLLKRDKYRVNETAPDFGLSPEVVGSIVDVAYPWYYPNISPNYQHDVYVSLHDGANSDLRQDNYTPYDGADTTADLWDWNGFYSNQTNYWIHIIGSDSKLNTHNDYHLPRGYLIPTKQYNVKFEEGLDNIAYCSANYIGSDFTREGALTTDANFVQIDAFNNDDDIPTDNRMAIVFSLEESGAVDVVENTGTTEFLGKFSCTSYEGGTTGTNSDSEFNVSFFECDFDEDLGSDNYINFLNSIGVGNLLTVNLGSNENSWGEQEILFESNGELENVENFITMNPIHSTNWSNPSNFNAASLRFSCINEGVANIKTKLYTLGVKHIVDIDNIFEKKFFVNSTGRSVSPNPLFIIKDIIETELNVSSNYDEENFNRIVGEISDNWNLAFSITEKTNSKKLIEEIAKSTPLLPYFKTTEKGSSLSFIHIKNSYNSFDINETIKSKDIINFKFTRTKIEKIKPMVRVHYSFDYGSKNYKKVTNYRDAYDLYGNKDMGRENSYSKSYLGLNPNVEADSILNFESPYIRDLSVANRLRDRLVAYNCNQHNIISFKVPLKYVHLQVGDIIGIDKLINKTKMFGEDYSLPTLESFSSRTYMRNGQEIYPCFIITSINKNTKNISIECEQLHNLTPTTGILETGNGDLNRAGNSASVDDFSRFEDFLLGYDNYITEGQIKNLDMNFDGLINFSDLSEYINFWDFNIEEEEEEEEQEIEYATYVDTGNYQGEMTLQHRLVGSVIDTNLADVPSDIGNITSLGVLSGSTAPVTPYQIQLEEEGFIQVSSTSWQIGLDQLVPYYYINDEGEYLYTYSVPTAEIFGATIYFKIGTEWMKANNMVRQQMNDGFSVVYKFSIHSSSERGLFTDPDDLVNYDSNATPPYVHSQGEGIKVYIGKPVFINTIIEED